jgi:hypothetical protein
MAYHESFWVAMAAATPIIALANTVAITDAVNLWSAAKTPQRSSLAKAYYFGIISVSIINLLVQASLLYDSLESLATEEDYQTVQPALIFTVGGLVYVLVIAATSIVLRYLLREDEARQVKRVEENTAKPRPRSKRKRHQG